MGNDQDPLQDWPGLFDLPFDGPRGKEIYYSFDWGSAHFTAVDTQGDLAEGSDQRTWLEGDLAAARARNVPWLIVFFHRAPYTVGRYGSGTLLAKTLEIRRLLAPIIDRFGVDLVLNAHDHNYQRTYPLRDGAVVGAGQDPHYLSPGGAIYVVAGGGGKTLYSETSTSDHTANRIFVKAFHAVKLRISADRIEGRAIAAGGSEIDAFSIERGFIRGDTDRSGSVGLPDVFAGLEYIFLSATTTSCLDCLDGNDDGAVDVSDSIYILWYLFAGGSPPPPPFPAPGPDPTPDDLPGG
jgi:Calcineurin-like phosphoesterase